jgi:hypothetical protein
MPIVSHTLESSLQANGSSNVTVRMYDQDATEYMQGFNAPAGFNIAGKVSSMIVERDIQLAENEFQALVGL